jgi:hypothetical protein
MSANSLSVQLEHIRDMCRELGDDDILLSLDNIPVSDALTVWERFLTTQDFIREKIFYNEHEQLRLERKRAAMLLLNKYIAITIRFELHGRVSQEDMEKLLKKRRSRYSKSSEDEDEEMPDSPSEEVIYCAKKRQRND